VATPRPESGFAWDAPVDAAGPAAINRRIERINGNPIVRAWRSNAMHDESIASKPPPV
jgi:hypothetical protein